MLQMLTIPITGGLLLQVMLYKGKVLGVGINSVVAVAQSHVVQKVYERRRLVLQKHTKRLKRVIEYIFYNACVYKKTVVLDNIV